MTKLSDRYEVHVMAGPPASGKSTYIQNYLNRKADDVEVVVISPDENIRAACGGTYEWTWWRARDAWKLAYDQLATAMKEAKANIIIFDATMCTTKARREMISNLAKFDRVGKYRSVLVLAEQVEIEELVRRDALRESHTVGRENIERMVDNLRSNPPKMEEGWDRIRSTVGG